MGENLSTFESVRDHLDAISDRREFIEKFKNVYEKNSGLQTLAKIPRILEGKPVEESNAYIDALLPNEINAFKYTPIVWCDVERLFSAYNRILEDCRHSFVFENLKKCVSIHCNKFD